VIGERWLQNIVCTLCKTMPSSAYFRITPSAEHAWTAEDVSRVLAIPNVLSAEIQSDNIIATVTATAARTVARTVAMMFGRPVEWFVPPSPKLI
jgi:hypothetical protein